MAVAVRNSPDTSTETVSTSLAGASFLGAIYVLLSLAVVTVGVPALWAKGAAPYITNSFLNAAGLIVVELFVVGLLAVFGLTLAGSPARLGLKAGVFGLAAVVIVTLWLMSVFAGSSVGDVIALALAGIVVFLVWRFMASPKFDDRIRGFEKQGWFTATGYKSGQGRKVRRATMLGLLVLAGCGIYTLIQHRTLDAVSKNWVVALPFGGGTQITVLPDVKYTVPLLLSALAFWISYRVVHMPVFAEFLIATEGELNKVAWPTRRSLWQDTVVVLTTVVLFTVFLFLVDVAWGKILGSPYIGVLKLESKKPASEAKELKELEW